MTVYRSWEELATLERPVYWAMGVFDGVHLGHRRVIESAARPGALRGVLTFDRHPMSLLCPERAPRLIVPDNGVKEDLLAALGVDALCVLPFTRELAGMEAAVFLDRLAAACPLAGISVGANWRFGAGRGGDAGLLRAQGEQRGFAVTCAPLAEYGGETVCSSAIRRHLAEGDFQRAVALLGHPLPMAGTVEEGRRLARQWNFPTANVRPRCGAMPPLGVYAARVRIDGEKGSWGGVANFGCRPTVDHPEAGPEPLLEVHLFQYDGMLYGRRLVVELTHFLRPERRFESLEALRAQIEADAAEASMLCRREGAL